MSKKVEEKPYCSIVEALYLEGYTYQFIAKKVGISITEAYNIVTKLGLPKRKPVEDENALVFADNSPPILEQEVIYEEWKIKNGVKHRIKRICTDVTPLYIKK